MPSIIKNKFQEVAYKLHALGQSVYNPSNSRLKELVGSQNAKQVILGNSLASSLFWKHACGLFSAENLLAYTLCVEYANTPSNEVRRSQCLWVYNHLVASLCTVDPDRPYRNTFVAPVVNLEGVVGRTLLTRIKAINTNEAAIWPNDLLNGVEDASFANASDTFHKFLFSDVELLRSNWGKAKAEADNVLKLVHSAVVSGSFKDSNESRIRKLLSGG